MIPRPDLLERIRTALRRRRVVAIVGPRQCGKTTLARKLVRAGAPEYFDLEDPRDVARLDEPMSALEPLRGTIVIDEIQRRPDLFPVLRVLADREPLPARFVILGSASPALLRQSSESLAGRIERIVMAGFTLGEVGPEEQGRHWLRGGFPLSFLAEDDEDSFVWRRELVAAFLERDVPQLGFGASPSMLYRFWAMVAHYHGQVWRAAEPARSLGIGETTARRYLDLLCDLLMLRSLPAWHANLKKRQVKSPKVYFRDTGILHHLLGIRDRGDLLRHPKSGASWEGYVVEAILHSTRPDAAHFWATHQGAELDLLLDVRGKRYGVECKRVDAPRLTPSMRIAMDDLDLERLSVVYPGPKRYALAEGVEAVPFLEAVEGMSGLFGS